jgi:DNA-binding SARP family transcriptional activator
LYLAAPAAPIAPFTTAEEAAALWRCGSSTRNTALLSAEEAARTPAPYPTLVSLGHTPEGDPVLVDLETMGLLSLDGSDGDVLAVLRAFTLELANSKLADDRLLLLAGVGEELAELYPTHADYYETLPEALAAIASQDAFQRQALEDGGHPSLRAARVSDPAAGDAWTPHILISADELAAPQAEQLVDILGAQPRTSIGVIAGNRTDLPVETSWRIPAEAGLEIELDGLPFTVILQRIEPDAYRHLVDVLATAERRDTLPAPAWARPDTTTAAAEPTEEDADQDAEMGEEPMPVGAVAATGSALAAQVPYAVGSPAVALGPSTISGTVTVPVALAKNTAVAPALPGLPPAAAGAAGSSREPQDLDLVEQEQGARAAAAISAASADEADREEDADPEEDVFGLADNEEDEDPNWGEDEEDLDALIARYAQDADDGQGEEQEVEQHGVRDTGQVGEQQTSEEGVEDDAVVDAEARQVTVPRPAPVGANARVSHRLHNSTAVLAALTADAAEPSIPYVRLLGRVEVLGLRDGKQDSRRRQLTEVAAWLVLNPGSSRLEFDEAMWPGTRVDNQGRNTLMSRARRWLGDKPDGSPYLPRITEDLYGLDPAVTCDWAHFQELYRAGHHGSGLDADIALAQALALVHGRPFAGTLATKYTWNEAWVQEMISAIEDAAHELAQRRLAERDYRAAAMAAARGLEAIPESELLYRDLFEVHAASGDRESLERAARRLHDLNEELGVDPEEETVELLETLLKGRRTATA